MRASILENTNYSVIVAAHTGAIAQGLTELPQHLSVAVLQRCERSIDNLIQHLHPSLHEVAHEAAFPELNSGSLEASLSNYSMARESYNDSENTERPQPTEQRQPHTREHRNAARTQPEQSRQPTATGSERAKRTPRARQPGTLSQLRQSATTPDNN